MPPRIFTTSGSRLPCTAVLACLAALIHGCASKPVSEPAPAPGPSPASDVATVTATDTTPAADRSDDERTAREALSRQGMTILFEYDSSQIAPRYVELIAAHARYLDRFAAVTVRLEGHSDERGTREYNIGLGERRAQAVRRALEIQGVALPRITTVSFGEERPVASGSGEQNWSQNRRVEIRYAP